MLSQSRISILRVYHVGICVSDLERSILFYFDGLGFQYVSRFDLEGKGAEQLVGPRGLEGTAVFLKRDGMGIKLLHYLSPGDVGPAGARPMNQLGLTHLPLRVDDVPSTAARLLDLGARPVEGQRMQGVMQGAPIEVLMLIDPEGTRVGLVHIPGDPYPAPGQTVQPQATNGVPMA